MKDGFRGKNAGAGSASPAGAALPKKMNRSAGLDVGGEGHLEVHEVTGLHVVPRLPGFGGLAVAGRPGRLGPGIANDGGGLANGAVRHR